MTSRRAWQIRYSGRVITTNAERSGNRWDRSAHTREWREAFGWLARHQRIPALPAIHVEAQPFQKGGRLQDTGACNPSVKAAIDGLVDAGVIPDDDPDHVLSIKFLRPQRGDAGLVLTVLEAFETDFDG